MTILQRTKLPKSVPVTRRIEADPSLDKPSYSCVITNKTQLELQSVNLNGRDSFSE